ncbi:hypothetical protein PTTG_08858 [Puccinia triticina 1-1 BBBD Race 1]|uniref:CSP domain-containing protein n=1 Tax=Puccinia triticina (isolate 1-1 / race 1 (BBBD)) TaxID=630390 RepID=A0A180G7L4_PUCT1|nr:hypothetical protein PTTG_08858 [Puccinia triticina 1-1 BBBD Race 1]WAR53493.1 hypothetical protein PtB15_3B1 [Puccinia triticina]
MSYENTYLTVNSPSFGRLPVSFPSASAMTPPMMPIIGYPGQQLMMASLSPHPQSPMTNTPVIDKLNPPPRRTGICKFFNVGKGFGFIKDARPEELPVLTGDPGTDIFVHYSCIVSCDAPYKSLLDGEIVEYYLGRSNKGLAALEITGPGGVNVKGCMNSRSPTVLQPMPNFSGPIRMITSPVTFGPNHSPNPSPIASPAFDYNTFPTSTGWSIPMSGAQTLGVHSNTAGYSLAVGMPLGLNQHLRRETTECLGVPNNDSSAKMYRVSSTPISAPGFGSTHVKGFRESANMTNLGVGIGIGVHWEPKSRGKPVQWSPPGAPGEALQELSQSHGRRLGVTSATDRTKSNWRGEDIKHRIVSLEINGSRASP